MNSLERLVERYPGARRETVHRTIALGDFALQRAKLLERPTEGGAIGCVWVAKDQLVLVHRTGLHAGWSLPGGTVESGEDFDTALQRELLEETGLRIVIAGLHLIENKIFKSPAGDILPPITLAVFEATAYGQAARTQEAGLDVGLFRLNELPQTMVLTDRQKILSIAAQRVAAE